MFEIYKTTEEDTPEAESKAVWHWRLLLGPGKRTIAISSGEGFSKRSAAIADIARVRSLAVVASTVETL